MLDYLTGLDLFNAVGILGVALYLGSYGALQLGLLRGQGYAYAMINAAAASCVLFSLWQNFNLSSALIQVFWIVISAVGIARLFIMRRRLRFTPEERDLLKTVMPDMPKEQARELLNLGNWFTAEPGHILTTESEPVPHLAYLAQGEATVTTSGRQVALIKHPAFIGEITCLDGEEATGTVKLTKPSLVFTIDARRLREYLTKNTAVQEQLEIAFSRELRYKLVALNQMVAGSTAYAINQQTPA